MNTIMSSGVFQFMLGVGVCSIMGAMAQRIATGGSRSSSTDTAKILEQQKEMNRGLVELMRVMKDK
jgi:hypothetical protein